LCFSRILEVARFQHFATVANHFTDGSRVVFAFIRSVEVNAARELVLIGQLAQPWTAQHLFAGGWTKPDLAAFHIRSNIGPLGFPPVNLIGRDRQAATAIQRAAFAALIAVFQEYLRFKYSLRVPAFASLR